MSRWMMIRDVIGVTLIVSIVFGALVLLIERNVIDDLYAFRRDVIELAEERPVDRKDADDTDAALAAVRKTAEQLRRSNEDLAQFAYVAAHDLRSPLLAIRDLVDWIEEDHGAALSAEIVESLGMLRCRANRLLTLLSDLLAYARAETRATMATRFDLEEVVRDAGRLLDPGGTFDISFRGDRMVTASMTPIRTIVMNLIANTMKHHDQPTGRIDVVSVVADDWLSLSFSDDGPGIPRRFHEKVFGVFQTLKSRDEVEGSGMGLAMVCRLARALGGRITLESDPDVARGATFILHIPVAAQVAHEVGRDADLRGAIP